MCYDDDDDDMVLKQSYQLRGDVSTVQSVADCSQELQQNDYHLSAMNYKQTNQVRPCTVVVVVVVSAWFDIVRQLNSIYPIK